MPASIRTMTPSGAGLDVGTFFEAEIVGRVQALGPCGCLSLRCSVTVKA